MADVMPTKTRIRSLSLRNILREGQTGVSPDHSIGYAWARTAYETAPERTTSSDQFLGEAAALTAIRKVLAGTADGIDWLDRAHGHIWNGASVAVRERSAVAIAAQREFAVNAWRGSIMLGDLERAREWRDDALANLRLNKRGERDPYETMLLRHSALAEHMAGNHEEAAQLAANALDAANNMASEGRTEDEQRAFTEHQRERALGTIAVVIYGANPRQTETDEQQYQSQLYQALGSPDAVAA